MKPASRSPNPLLMFSIALTICLTGCESKDDLNAYIKGVKSQVPSEPPPIPELSAYTPYTYPGHTLNPFDAQIVAPQAQSQKVAAGNASIDPNRVKEYLENFPLDSLNMVGTMTQGDVLWALIQTSDSTVQRIKTGNYLGEHYGKVQVITATRVELIEVVSDGFGGYMEHPTSIALSNN